jgi:chromosome segregation ATPase
MVQDGSLDFRLVQRVCALQQALDQALLSLEDLRGQLQDQDWLETQLAKTEKYANVQQQAIAYLKSQLSQVTNHQRHVLHQLLVHLEDWVNGQQVALNRLQLQIDQGEAELQTFLQHIRTRSPDQSPFIPASNSCEMDLEAEVMVARSATVSLGTQLQAARYHLQTLTQVLHQHHGDMTQLAIAIQTMLNTLAAEREAATLDLEPEEAATAQPEVIPPYQSLTKPACCTTPCGCSRSEFENWKPLWRINLAAKPNSSSAAKPWRQNGTTTNAKRNNKLYRQPPP